jgi:hypothetical protein
MKLRLRFNTMPDKPLCMKPGIIRALVVVLMTGIIPGMPTASLGSTEEREKHAPRSSVYKGEVIVHEATKLIMKDSNGQRIELNLGPDTLIRGRPGAPFREGDLIEADVTPEGHAKSIRPRR